MSAKIESKTKKPVPEPKVVKDNVVDLFTANPEKKVKKPTPPSSKVSTRIIYIRNQKMEALNQQKGPPVGCLAYRAIPVDGGFEFEYGLSVRNPVDHWSKAIGREIAMARITRRPTTQQNYLGNSRDMTWSWGSYKVLKQDVMKKQEQPLSLHEALEELFYHLSQKEIPMRIRKHMKRVYVKYHLPEDPKNA